MVQVAIYEYADNPIEHPLASIDRDFRSVDCTTDLSSLEPKEIAKLIVNVNNNATNSFIQHIRRRLSILERPLTTAREDGKSYIYSNFNSTYAQMALTIPRTYNFCLPSKTKEGKQTSVKTPAQRLGITDKEFFGKYYISKIRHLKKIVLFFEGEWKFYGKIYIRTE
ncbi:hypothetical protein [Terribacillus aidingensis]|uniref:hypothetical protein n=1 Tax=Terribacillus aidingensis TaxID=586416 RepID=UPI00268F22D8